MEDRYINITITHKGRSTHITQSSSALRSNRRTKVHFSPLAVGKGVGYNDVENVVVNKGIGSRPPASSLRKSNLRSSLRINTSIKEKLMESGKLEDTNAAIAKAGGNKRKRNAAADYPSPSTSPDCASSPESYLEHRYPEDHSNAVWDPRGHSTSGSFPTPNHHIPLPQVLKHRSRNNPEVTFIPRKWSTDSCKSSEYNTIKRGAKRRKGRADETVEPARKRVQAKRKATNKTKHKDNRFLNHRNVNSSTSAISSSKPRKGGVDNTEDEVYSAHASYSNTPLLPSSLLSKGDIIYRNNRNLLTSLNASSNSIKRRAKGAENPTSSSSVKKRRLGPKPEQASKRRKLSGSPEKALERGGSNPQGSWGEEDYIEPPSASVENTTMSEWDILTEDSFVPPLKKSKSTSKSKLSKAKGSEVAKVSQAKVAKKTKAKKPSAKAVKAAAAAACAAAEAESQRKREKEAPKKRTLSGRPFVEPVVLARAQKLGKLRRKPWQSIASGGPVIEKANDSELMGTPTLPIASSNRERKARGKRLATPATLSSLSSQNQLDFTVRQTKSPPSANTSSLDVKLARDLRTTRDGLVMELSRRAPDNVISKTKTRGRSAAKEVVAAEKNHTEKLASKKSEAGSSETDSGTIVKAAKRANAQISKGKSRNGKVKRETAGEQNKKVAVHAAQNAAKGKSTSGSKFLAQITTAKGSSNTRSQDTRSLAASKAKAVPARKGSALSLTSTLHSGLAISPAKAKTVKLAPKTRAAPKARLSPVSQAPHSVSPATTSPSTPNCHATGKSTAAAPGINKASQTKLMANSGVDVPSVKTKAAPIPRAESVLKTPRKANAASKPSRVSVVAKTWPKPKVAALISRAQTGRNAATKAVSAASNAEPAEVPAAAGTKKVAPKSKAAPEGIPSTMASLRGGAESEAAARMKAAASRKAEATSNAAPILKKTVKSAAQAKKTILTVRKTKDNDASRTVANTGRMTRAMSKAISRKKEKM